MNSTNSEISKENKSFKESAQQLNYNQIKNLKHEIKILSAEIDNKNQQINFLKRKLRDINKELDKFDKNKIKTKKGNFMGFYILIGFIVFIIFSLGFLSGYKFKKILTFIGL